MARRWTVAEAVAALRVGDKIARNDIARRFPLFATASPEELLGAISMVSARQLEARLRGDEDFGDDADAEDDEDEKPESVAANTPSPHGRRAGSESESKRSQRSRGSRHVVMPQSKVQDDELEHLFDDDDE